MHTVCPMEKGTNQHILGHMILNIQVSPRVGRNSILERVLTASHLLKARNLNFGRKQTRRKNLRRREQVLNVLARLIKIPICERVRFPCLKANA